MTGVGRLPEKDRRRIRRRNHIVKDLRDAKYHQRVVHSKKKKKGPVIEEFMEEFDNTASKYLDDEYSGYDG